MPVSRVKDLNPLGHSGHLKLHEVVGSIVTDTGIPHTNGRLKIFEIVYPDKTANKLNTRRGVVFESKLRKSLVPAIIGTNVGECILCGTTNG
jgi:hypothetical protein